MNWHTKPLLGWIFYYAFALMGFRAVDSYQGAFWSAVVFLAGVVIMISTEVIISLWNFRRVSKAFEISFWSATPIN